MIRAIIVTALCASLAACAAQSGPDHVEIQKSLIPIAVACTADPGPEPAWFDTSAAIASAPNIFELAKLYAAGRQQHLAWEASLKAANSGCQAAPSTVPAR